MSYHPKAGDLTGGTITITDESRQSVTAGRSVTLHGSPVAGESWAHLLRTWRRAALAALTAGAAIATQLAALAPSQAAVPPTITIAATSKIKPVTGDVYVVFHGGTSSTARIHGTISVTTAGQVATLYAQRFPYTKPAKPISSHTLPTGTATPYSFTVTPSLATRYTVKLSAGSTLVAHSPTHNVYVVTGGSVKGGSRCGRPVCHETFRLFVILPSSALRREMSKHIYPYFGIRLGTTAVPPAPKWLYLNAGHATLAPPRRISASEYEQTLKYSFTIGNHAYNWSWTSCVKDTVSKDGLGLPGHHSCGASRVLRTVQYLG